MNILLILLILAGIGAVAFAMLYMGARGNAQRISGENQTLKAELDKARTARQTAEQERATALTHRDLMSNRLSDTLRDLETLRTEHLAKTKALASLEAKTSEEIRTLREQNAADRKVREEERAKQEEQFRQQFKLIANEVLGEQTAHFKKTNEESMDTLLRPFRDNITDFRRRVEEIYSKQNEQRGELKNELQQLMDLNRRITDETTNLTNALKGNSKVQGDWGEMLLETILDSSSLIKGIHYETQHNLKDEQGHNLRPDVVLNLPEDKHIIIDSKVSLTAFVNYTAAEDPAERSRFLKAHIESVRNHVAELAPKKYQKRINSLEFVIMFVANEPAFLTALQNDQTIWSDAYAKQVIISSPTNLFALLKMVADMWRVYDQNANTKKIAEEAEKLYNKAVGFTQALEEVGKGLDTARAAYDTAHKRLSSGRGCMVSIGENLRRIARIDNEKRFSDKMLENIEEEGGNTLLESDSQEDTQ